MAEPPVQDAVPCGLPATALAALGWSGLWVTTRPNPAHLAPLAAALRADGDAVHAWRTPLLDCADARPTALAEALLRAAETERPTTVFTFLGVRSDGTLVPAGMAAVSARIRPDFAHDGFPVLARAFVAPGLRGHGVYRAMLHHRVAYCRRVCGDGLRAIHLGTAEPSIQATLAEAPVEGLRFVHVGDETLAVARDAHVVRDYLAPTEGFLARIEEDARALPFPVRDRVIAFSRSGAAAVRWPILRDALAPCRPRDGSVAMLVDLCEAIPLYA